MKPRCNATLPLLMAAVVFLATSCSMARRVQTSRTVTIEGKVTQMPTVAELDVSPQQATADAEWVNHLFKGTTSLKAQEQELIAQILSTADADVLIEPKIAHESRRHWFRSNHRLSISGYPARYKEFRIATMEDIEKINELRHPANARPTVILAQSTQPATLTPPSASRTVRIGKALPAGEKVRKPFSRKSGYRGFVEGSYINFFCSNDYSGDGYAFSTIHGAQIGQHFFAGVGVGYFGATLEDNSYDAGYYDSRETEAQLVPVFANLKAYLLKKRFSPYIDLRGGYDVCDTESYYLSGGIGFSFGHLDFGANYYKFKPFSGIQARIGISF